MTSRLEAAVAELAEALRAELRAEAPDPSAPDRLMSILDAAAALSVGRSSIYAELQAGRLRSIHVGRRVLIPSGAITDYIASRS